MTDDLEITEQQWRNHLAKLTASEGELEQQVAHLEGQLAALTADRRGLALRINALSAAAAWISH